MDCTILFFLFVRAVLCAGGRRYWFEECMGWEEVTGSPGEERVELSEAGPL